MLTGMIVATPGRQIMDVVAKSRLLTLLWTPGGVDEGKLMAYSAVLSTCTVTRKGAKPTDLPAKQPTQFELVVNIKTAMVLGLTILPSLLTRTGRVSQ